MQAVPENGGKPMNQMRTLRPDDVSQIAECDAARHAYFFRGPDRPDGKFVKPHGRVPPEVRKAQTRLRTARWRSEMDRRKAPTLAEVGMALATALATTRFRAQLTPNDLDLLQRALLDLKARGFSIDEAKRTLRRLRIKMLDPADRAGEASESTGAPVRLPDEAELPF
jgi:hypothetical protein